MKLIMSALLILCSSFPVFAKQSVMDELKNTCEVSGGRWVDSGGNWACCWSDWGCYGCVDGLCKMKCETQRCKDANGQKRPGPGEMTVNGLAPTGNMSPIVPKKRAVETSPTIDTLNKKH